MRPLFEPLSHRHERSDEWCGPLGFVVGGFARLSERAERNAALAEEYFAAAETLLAAIVDRQVADYKVANAALFLYRHCFELLLKAGLPKAVRSEKRFIISVSWRGAMLIISGSQAILSLHGIHRLDKLAAIDPTSELFRSGDYGFVADKAGNPLFEESHVDVAHLMVEMRRLNGALAQRDCNIRLAR